MIACHIDEKFRGDKISLNKNFSKFRYRNGTSVTYKQISSLDDILTCDVLVAEELKDGYADEGYVVTKDFLKDKTHTNVIALSKVFFTGTSYIVFFDIDDPDTFDSWESAKDFIEKTYRLKLAGLRKSSSGKDGKYHGFAILDAAIDIKLIKKYIHALTPGQERILIAKEGQRPRTELFNPYVDLKVYSAARLTYNMRSHGWLYRSDVINKSTKITKGLNRIKPLPVKNGINAAEFSNAKETHRKQLGVTKQQYDFMESSSLIHPDDTIYRDGVAIKISDAKDDTRYSFYPHQKSPSLHHVSKGKFIDFEDQKSYSVSDIYTYKKYIADSIFDFDHLSGAVIHAMTGSGKTWMFEKPGFLIAVPRRSQATIKTGTSTGIIIRKTLKKHRFITHDKLTAHIDSDPGFLGKLERRGIKIIVDEAHMLTKGKKFETLWALDNVVFLSGTVRDYFRPDITHVHFLREKKVAPVILCKAMPEVEGKFLYFADRVNVFANGTPDSCLVAAAHYDNMAGHYGRKIKPPKILTQNTGATSAYREGVTIKTDGGKWSVIVDMNQCKTWTYSDAIQALWRVRGDDVDRYLILTDTEWARMPTTKAFVPDFVRYAKRIGQMKITKERVLRGAGLNQNFSKMIFSPSQYSSASTFGTLRYLDTRNAKVLPVMYTYEKFEGEYIDDPWDMQPEKEIACAEEDEEIEEMVFEIGNTRYISKVPKNELAIYGDWKDAMIKGFMAKLEEAYIKHDGKLFKMHKVIKDNKARCITIRDLVKALRHLTTVNIYHKDGRKMKNYSANAVKIKVLKFSPFEVVKEPVLWAN